jgi:hypothetical protein
MRELMDYIPVSVSKEVKSLRQKAQCSFVIFIVAQKLLSLNHSLLLTWMFVFVQRYHSIVSCVSNIEDLIPNILLICKFNKKYI